MTPANHLTNSGAEPVHGVDTIRPVHVADWRDAGIAHLRAGSLTGMSTPQPPERPDTELSGSTPHEVAEPVTEAATPTYRPYSESDDAGTSSDAYSQATGAPGYGQTDYGLSDYDQADYGESATSSYHDPRYGHPDPVEAATTVVSTPNPSAVRRWQIIAVLAVTAAALTILGFGLFGIGNRGGTTAPATQTVTEVTEYEGAETTRTQTATTTETETRTATETQRGTVTRTETQTATATATVTETETETVSASAPEPTGNAVTP